jgi:hypothetical protein
MSWSFVGRAEQLNVLRQAVLSRLPGLVMITGEPGIGRSALLTRALDSADRERNLLVRLEPSGELPFAALRRSFPGIQPTATPTDAAQAIAYRSEGRHLVLAADDAHLMDYATLLALREVRRDGRALLLVTSPHDRGPAATPDPLECLRCEFGFQQLVLRPLSTGEVAAVLADALGGPAEPATVEALHAATGGNPRRLHTLVAGSSLVTCMTPRPGRWRLGTAGTQADLPCPVPGRPAERGSPDASGDRDVERVIEAAWSAWHGLAYDRADQLCRLALWYGVQEEIAPIWAALLLRGNGPDARDILETLSEERLTAVPRLALVTALTLAFGHGRSEDACGLLAKAAARADSRERVLAHHAWLLAVTGSTAQAVHEIEGIDRNDPETALFVHATRAVLTLRAQRPAEAVFHLRRALAIAEAGSDECPWMRPFLKASLIDALLLSGRAHDAVSVARRFHARERGSGWDIAVALNCLLAPEWSAVGATTPPAVAAKTPELLGFATGTVLLR